MFKISLKFYPHGPIDNWPSVVWIMIMKFTHAYICHYNYVTMSTMASQLTSLKIVHSTVIQAQIRDNINAPRHWPLCVEFTGTGEFPTQRASNAENVSIWWRHHGLTRPPCFNLCLTEGLLCNEMILEWALVTLTWLNTSSHDMRCCLTRMTIICVRYLFQMNFLDIFVFNSNFCEVCSQWSNWQYLAWYRQVISHYLNQYPKSLTHFGVTGVMGYPGLTI